MTAPRRLILEDRGDDVVFELLQPVVTIGRDEGLDLVWDDPQVSKRHCEIRLSGSRLLLRDLGSTNGTFVNGMQTSYAELKAGDVVTVGGHAMHVDDRRGGANRPAGASVRASAPAVRVADATADPIAAATAPAAEPPAPRTVPARNGGALAAAGIVAAFAVVGFVAWRALTPSAPLVDPRLAAGRARLAAVAELARADRGPAAEAELAEIDADFGETALRPEIERLRATLAAAFAAPPLKPPSRPVDVLPRERAPEAAPAPADFDTQFAQLLAARRYVDARKLAARSPHRDALERALEGALSEAAPGIERDYAARVASDGDGPARTWLADVLRGVPVSSPTYAALQDLLLTGAVVARAESATRTPSAPAAPGAPKVPAKGEKPDAPAPPDSVAKLADVARLVDAGDLVAARAAFDVFAPAARGRSRAFDHALDRAARGLEAEAAFRAAVVLGVAAGADVVVNAGEGVAGRALGADGAGLLIAATGTPVAVAWRVLPAAAHAALAEKLALAVEERVAAATVLYRLGRAEDAERLLARAAAKATETEKARIDRAVADGRDLPMPEAGFALVDGRLLSPAEVARRELNLAIAAATKGLAEKESAARRSAFEAFVALGDDARPSLHRALLDRRVALAGVLAKDPVGKRIETVAERRQEIDFARTELLGLIFDEVKYPYPYRPPQATAEQFASYVAQQALIDERTGVLRKKWADAEAVKIPPAYAARAAELAECVAWIAECGAPEAAAEPAHLVLLPTSAEVTVRNVALDAGDREKIDASEAVMAANAAMKGFGSRGEVDQARITNEYRMMLGKRALAFYDPIARAARGHCEDMVAHGFFAHESPLPGKASPYDRMKLQGVNPQGGGENLARASGAQGAFEGWRGSSGHHRNMLESGWRYIGVGNVGNHWCQLFIVRDGAAPDHAAK